MPENTAPRWTSDHLMKPGGTALYGDQQRARLRQMAHEVQALLHEYRADLESLKLDGDKPLEAKWRAYVASRPLARLERDLRNAVKDAGRLDKEFQRLYVELPKKRRQRAHQKALDKAVKKGQIGAQGMNTAANFHGLSGMLEDSAGNSSLPARQNADGGGETFVDFLQKQA